MDVEERVYPRQEALLLADYLEQQGSWAGADIRRVLENPLFHAIKPQLKEGRIIAFVSMKMGEMDWSRR